MIPRKSLRAARLDRARGLLIERGFVADSTQVPDITPDLVSEFGIQRRTARRLAAQAARLLRGDVVAVWASGAGRPASHRCPKCGYVGKRDEFAQGVICEGSDDDYPLVRIAG